MEKIRKPGKVDLGYLLCINNKTATLKVACFFYRSLRVLRLRRLSSRSDINTNISLPFPTSDAAAVIGETNTILEQSYRGEKALDRLITKSKVKGDEVRSGDGRCCEWTR